MYFDRVRLLFSTNRDKMGDVSTLFIAENSYNLKF